MMAKMFYTLEEAKTALGIGEDEIKQLTRDGKLREFRDGPRLMFKADQVEALKAEIAPGHGDQINLASDTGLSFGLAESGKVAADSSGTRTPTEDPGLAIDLGLSGSVGGVPSPARGSGLSGSGLSNQSSKSGVNVFGSDEMPAVDPAAQTEISAAMHDQISLESVGSGSGLLDLTRESDDTSLGAELLDEIAPKSNRSASDSAAAVDIGEAAISEPREGVTTFAPPVFVEAADPLAPAFGAAALGAAFFLLFGAFILVSAIVGVRPAILKTLTGDSSSPFSYVTIIGLIVAGVFFAGGLAIAKVAGKR